MEEWLETGSEVLDCSQTTGMAETETAGTHVDGDCVGSKRRAENDLFDQMVQT